jgi:hypothetical protein
MKECEIRDCTNEGRYYEHLNLTLCTHHKQEYEDELYWEEYYKKNRIGAYAGQKNN